MHGLGKVPRILPQALEVGISTEHVQEKPHHAVVAPTYFVEHPREARVASRNPFLGVKQDIEVAHAVCPRCKSSSLVAGQQHGRAIRVAQMRRHEAQRPFCKELEHEGHHLRAVHVCSCAAAESAVAVQIRRVVAAINDHREHLIFPRTADHA